MTSNKDKNKILGARGGSFAPYLRPLTPPDHQLKAKEPQQASTPKEQEDKPHS